jgi:hypothetical protein
MALEERVEASEGKRRRPMPAAEPSDIRHLSSDI